jgi:hypothetical protein
MIKTNRALFSTLLIWMTLFFASEPARAGWQTDVGYNRLGVELGAARPDGTGLTVDHVEAAVAVGEYDTWMPDPTNTAFAGKNIVDQTGPTPIRT